MAFENVINTQDQNKGLQFKVALKTLPQEGNLVYEYNPFRNYRLTEPGYLYNNRLYFPKELLQELKIESIKEQVKEEIKYTKIEGLNNQEIIELLKTFKNWNDEGQFNNSNFALSLQDTPVLVEAGELTDFETDELSFDLKHPVNITPQYSYDNSVNLIINDGKNKPRLINSRFSATERNKYQIVDRKGNNDTNIYDQGSQFDIDTSLYKIVVEIPTLNFIGVSEGGILSVGNYHFYFRYVDDDGNQTDFVAESGLVSLFIGNTPSSIRSGFRDEDSHKIVRFLLSNVDSAYQNVEVYFTRSSSDINENAVVTAYRINQKYLVNNLQNCEITITGYEDISQVSVDEINPSYQLFDSVETQATCQNMLFLANVDKPNIPYEDLADIALRFTPYLQKDTYALTIDQNYNPSSYSLGYYDPKYIYNNVGYWNHEIYRLGIVFILSDSSLTPVFNVRGASNLNTDITYTPYLFQKNGSRRYISYEEDTALLVSENNSDTIDNSEDTDISDTTDNSVSAQFENAKGIIKLEQPTPQNEGTEDADEIIYSINFHIDKEVLDYLKNTLKIKGFFFVRQKRIPTILAQALTIPIDKQSNTPVMSINNGGKHFTEGFLTDKRILDNVFENRIKQIDSPIMLRNEGAICPEYDVNSPYLNTLFCGDTFTICRSDYQPKDFTRNERHIYQDGKQYKTNNAQYNVQIIGVEDNVKLVAINDHLFSARAGEAEEAFRYEYIGYENNVSEAHNLLRGSFGPYLGIVGFDEECTLIDIKVPGYSTISVEDLFKIRYNDKAPYYAISERIDINKENIWFESSSNNSENDTRQLRNSLYRGDCYICQFTHRVNRNFQDPSAPINDKIVDKNCWKDHYEIADGVLKTENFDEINLGDVNAVKLGMYITFTVRSSRNLNIRSVDDSIPDETALTGHPRGFYPYFPLTADGAYKTPEALCCNKGFEKGLSERYNFEVPNVPAIKNEFSNRIAYSDIYINDAFKNGFRVFQKTHYRDYPKTYGSITKIIELRGNLLCVFEHGVALIPVNERAIASEGAGGNAYINTSNVLPENPKIISDQYGSQWRESIIKTPRAVYGVDTVGRKIWRTNGENFELISDFQVQEFLNQNISLTERELEPIIGIRNVKTHFNRFKNDVMFTFYDNLYGFEEKVWNLCYNENLQKWITFYSWVPSYSENIYNQYFSFDRNTSKWIAKLGVSLSDNNFSDGVVLSNNVIPNDLKSGNQVGNLSLANRTLPEGKGINTTIYYTLERDNYKNYKNFQIKYEVYTIENGTKKYTGETLTLDQVKNSVDKLYDSNLYLTTDASNLCSELYVRGKDQEISTLETITAKEGEWEKLSNGLYRIYEDDKHSKYTDYNPNIHRCVEKKTTLEVTLNFYSWLNNCVINSNYPIYKDDRGRRVWLSQDQQKNPDKVVILLNIRANIKVSTNTEPTSLEEAYATGYTDRAFIDAGYYQSVVALIPEYNMQFLTTDFWKHGQAGIIDIADKIYPTYWYGKQHPFEFEFVVADNPQAHKIFDNLQIISNNAEPESFHYEVVGDSYNFAEDKKNMYIRQEATKELYQYNRCDVIYDHDYSDLESVHRPLKDSNGNIVTNNQGETLYDKSALLPLYYSRQDTINEIEDYYHLKDDISTKDFSALAGGEIVHYKTLDEYRIWNHAKAVDMQTKGRLRGNMQYNEDKWLVQINPINVVYKNELSWDQGDIIGNRTVSSEKVPIELGQSPIPDEILEKGEINYDPNNPANNDIPENSMDRTITSWDWKETQIQEVKLKDKWIKIRIRYTGNKLAVITAIKTLYSIIS